MILVPTRELSMQVESELNRLGRFTPIKALAVYGGKRLSTQANALAQKKPQIIVGTPGRVMDLHQRGLLPYDAMTAVILDEVDRMLDIGFRDDIRKILGGMPKEPKPQYVFVSATISPEIESLARKFMRDAEKIVTTEGALTVKQVDQSYISVQPWDKRRLLLYLLQHVEPDLTLVFCRTKETVDRVAQHLHKHDVDVHALHGDMPQSKRSAIVKKLRAGSLSVVVASDLAARGLDVSGISHVINYDLPEDPEVYVHRIGRTARAGRHGIAWSFVTSDQGKLLTAIEKLANIEIRQETYEGFVPGPPPADSRGGGARGGGAARDSRATLHAAPKPEPAARSVADAAVDGAAHAPSTPVPPSPPEADPLRFPGGVVPTRAPRRVLGGKVPSRRR